MKKRYLLLIVIIALVVVFAKGTFSATCGNGMCEQGETALNCELDCTGSYICGDTYCQPENNEDCSSCSIDCGACDGEPCESHSDCNSENCQYDCAEQQKICMPEGETTPECCDGKDNDCDGTTDEGFDSDNDGFTSCGGDCDDDDVTINPGAEEDCDGIDSNCNNIPDVEEKKQDGSNLCSCNFIKESTF